MSTSDLDSNSVTYLGVSFNHSNGHNPFLININISELSSLTNSANKTSSQVELIKDSCSEINDSVNRLLPKVESIKDTSNDINAATAGLYNVIPSNLGSIPGLIRTIITDTAEVKHTIDKIKSHQIKEEYFSFLEFLKYNAQLFTVMGVFGSVTIFLKSLMINDSIKNAGALLSTSIFAIISFYIILESRKIKDINSKMPITKNFIIKNLFIYIFSVMVMLIIMNSWSPNNSSFILTLGLIILSISAFFGYLLSEVFQNEAKNTKDLLFKTAFYLAGFIILIITLVCYSVLSGLVSPESANLLPYWMYIFNNIWWLILLFVVISLAAILRKLYYNFSAYYKAFLSLTSWSFNRGISLKWGDNLLRWIFLIMLIYVTVLAVNASVLYQKDTIAYTWINETNNMTCTFYPNNTFYGSANTTGKWFKIDDVNYYVIVYNSNRVENVSIIYPDKDRKIIYFDKDPSNLLYANRTGYYYSMNLLKNQ